MTVLTGRCGLWPRHLCFPYRDCTQASDQQEAGGKSCLSDLCRANTGLGPSFSPFPLSLQLREHGPVRKEIHACG